MAAEEVGAGLPPHDEDAEWHVLGALLTDDQAIAQVAGLLRAEDFFFGTHRRAYAVMLALHERGEPTDVSLVRAELERRDELEKVGGSSTLTRWIMSVPTAVNLLHYAGLVADRAARRRLLQASGAIANAAYDADTAAQAVAQAAGILATASLSPDVGRAVDFDVLVGQTWDEVSKAVDARSEGEVVEPGLATGFATLDRITGGMRPGDLVLLAARPSMGKTAMAVQVAVDVAGRGHPVLFFSLEMPGKDVAGRALWARAGVNSHQARRGLLDEAGLAALADAVAVASPLPIRVDDTPGLPVAVLAGRARAYRAERGRLGLVIVDYLQLLKGAPRRDGNRVAEVTEISQALKTLARDLECPVLALSQLNRAVEHRADAQPGLSDLRDSGSLEQDADQVVMLWKENRDADVGRVAVAKNRNGPTGSFDLGWNAQYARFEEWFRASGD
jgi:replicative DNA helicase